MSYFAFVSATPLALRSSLLPATAQKSPARRQRYTISTNSLPAVVRACVPEDRDAQPAPAQFLAACKRVAASSQKALVASALAALLIMPQSLPADAASAGGRVGGSNFRRSAPAPSRSYSTPTPGPGYGGGYGGGYGYGPSFGFGAPMFFNPFIAPIGGFGMGIGGLGSFLLIAAVASFALDLLRARADAAAGGADGSFGELDDPTVAVAVVKVGLLASARKLQVDLDALARSADTSSTEGLAFVLSETLTALLRNPDYWSHGATDVRALPLSKAEGEFNETCLAERLKLDEETLTNAAGRVAEAARASATEKDMEKAPGEYIIVSLIVAAAGELVKKLPKNIDEAKDVERALRALATVSDSSLQGVEVIWAPQSLRDTVSEKEMLADHPELRRL